ncbi:MAG: HEAT repeat domain-containing protein, partial [Candidatus Omnitrophica bacterium]|nr:HEAT repeat domain-containing protein [Candidatus Omnitrophota bacterium]
PFLVPMLGDKKTVIYDPRFHFFYKPQSAVDNKNKTIEKTTAIWIKNVQGEEYIIPIIEQKYEKEHRFFGFNQKGIRYINSNNGEPVELKSENFSVRGVVFVSAAVVLFGLILLAYSWINKKKWLAWRKGVNANQGVKLYDKELQKQAEERFAKRVLGARDIDPNWSGNGAVAEKDFLVLGVDAKALFENLIKNGYINDKGIIQHKFDSLQDFSKMDLDSVYQSKKEGIYNILRQARKGRLIAANGSFTGVFLFNLLAIYMLTMRWLQLKNPGLDLQGDDQDLVNLDNYCKGAMEYLDREIGRGACVLKETKDGRYEFEGDAHYVMFGLPDPNIWDKLETYFAGYRERIRSELANEIAKQDKTSSPIEDILKEMGINEGGFFAERFNQQLRSELDFDGVHERKFEGMEFLMSLSVAWKGIKNNSEKNDIKDYAAGVKDLSKWLTVARGELEKLNNKDSLIVEGQEWRASYKNEINKLIEQIQNILDCEALKECTANINADALRTLRDYFNDIFKSTILKDTYKYQKLFNKDIKKRYTGIGIRAIHPLAFEFASFMPRLLFVAVGIVVIFNSTNAFVVATMTSALLLTAPVFGIFTAILALAVTSIILEWNKLSRFERQNKITSIVMGIISLSLVLGIGLFLPAAGLGFAALKLTACVVLLSEGLGHLLWRHSLIGMSFYYHFRPSIGTGRTRAIVLYFTQLLSLFAFGLFMGWAAYPWFISHYLIGLNLNCILATSLFTISLYLMNYGFWQLFTFIASWFTMRGPKAKALTAEEISRIMGDNLFGLNYVGAFLLSPGIRGEKFYKEATEKLIQQLLYLLANNSKAAEIIIDNIKEQFNAMELAVSDDDTEFVTRDIRNLVLAMYEAENRSKVSLWNLRQLNDESDMPADLKIKTADKTEKKKIVLGFNISRYMTVVMGSRNLMDTGTSIMDMAEALKEAGIGSRCVFLLTDNKFERHHDSGDTPDNTKDMKFWGFSQDEKMLRLFAYLSGGQAYFTYIHTNFSMKSTTMNGLFAAPEILRRIRQLLILDRNANVLNLGKFIVDVKRIITNPNMVINVSHRGTPNIYMPMGDSSRLVEEGHGNSMLGLNDKVGTGWGNQMAVYYGEVVNALSNAEYPMIPFGQGARGVRKDSNWRYYGLIGFGPNAVGISEDFWAVLQQTHNAIGLGYEPEFGMSEAFWHKLRESYSVSEWIAAAPRWSGGLNQTTGSFIQQNINELGPESIFEREARRNVARFYITSPFAVAMLALIVLSIIFDFSPFVGVKLLFLISGLIFNQILTLHGLGASARASGLIVGLSRWLQKRLRDVQLFATRVILEALAFIKSYGGLSFKFEMSGAGGASNEKLDFKGKIWQPLKQGKFKLISLPAVYLIGIVLTLANIICLLVGLDVTNAITLFLTLYFSVSIVVGIFTMDNKPVGRVSLYSRSAKFVGFIISATTVVTLGLAINVSVWFAIIPSVLIAVVIYLAYKNKASYQDSINNIAKMYKNGFGKLFGDIKAFSDDITKITEELGKITDETQKAVKAEELRKKKEQLTAKEKEHENIKQEIVELYSSKQARAVSDFISSYWAGFAALIWFVIVPLSEVFIYTSFSGVLSAVLLSKFLMGVGWVVAIIIAYIGLAKLYGNFMRKEQISRYNKMFNDYYNRRDNLDNLVRSKAEALFIQFLVFIDQEAYKYAKGTLKDIERITAPYFELWEIINRILNQSFKKAEVDEFLKELRIAIVQRRGAVDIKIKNLPILVQEKIKEDIHKAFNEGGFAIKLRGADSDESNISIENVKVDFSISSPIGTSSPITGAEIIIGIFAIAAAIGLYFAAWRIFFPVSWYTWRLKTNLKYNLGFGFDDIYKTMVNNLQDLSLKPLLNILFDKGKYDKSKIIWRIENIARKGNKEASESLIRALAKERYQCNIKWILISLGNIGEKKAADFIERIAADSNYSIKYQQEAAISLGKLGDLRAVKYLIYFARSIDHSIAINLLGKLRDLRALEPLIEMLGDKNYLIRQEAAAALRQLGDLRALEPLMIRWNDREASVCEVAAKAVIELIDNNPLTEITLKNLNIEQSKLFINLLRKLIEKNMPVSYFIQNVLPKITKTIESNSVLFETIMDLGKELIKKDIPLCDTLEVGLDEISELSHLNLKMLEKAAILWHQKFSNIINSLDNYHSTYRYFIKKIVSPLIMRNELAIPEFDKLIEVILDEIVIEKTERSFSYPTYVPGGMCPPTPAGSVTEEYEVVTLNYTKAINLVNNRQKIQELKNQLETEKYSSSPITDSDLRVQAEEAISAWKDAFTGRSAELEYLFNIYLRYLKGARSYRIGKDLANGENFIPSALLTEEERRTYLGAVNYADLAVQNLTQKFSESAKNVDMVANPLDGGLGAAVARKKYLNNRAQTESDVASRARDARGDIKLGAKGTDLAFDVTVNGITYKISVAEIKLLRLLSEASYY